MDAVRTPVYVQDPIVAHLPWLAALAAYSALHFGSSFVADLHCLEVVSC